MSSLTLLALNKSYGDVEVLHDLNLNIVQGEFVVFVGPSGCGKSTLLRLLAGLGEVTSGEIRINDKVVNTLEPAQRGIAMVFQSYALYPHMNVRDNMSFGMRMADMPKSEIAVRIDKAATMLQLQPLLNRLPRELSGGQRQRVAIGRAITRDPKIFLFDEPLSNLDASLRVATRAEIAKLKQAMPDTTMIYVTHDQVEAMTLADKIVVMEDGRIVQEGTPMDLYHRPAVRFVAGFIGSPGMNFIDASSTADNAIQTASGDPIHLPYLDDASQITEIAVRPEDLQVVLDGPVLVTGEVELVENLGELQIIHVNISSGNPVLVKVSGDAVIALYSPVKLGISPDKIHAFDANGLSLRPTDVTQ